MSKTKLALIIGGCFAGALALAAGTLVIVVIYLIASPAPRLPRPLFHNEKRIHPETGREVWLMRDFVEVGETNNPKVFFVIYDELENVVVVGQGFVSIPTRQSSGDVIAGGAHGDIKVPITRDTLIWFNEKGIVRTAPLRTRKAEAVFEMFKRDPSLEPRVVCDKLDDNSLP